MLFSFSTERPDAREPKPNKQITLRDLQQIIEGEAPPIYGEIAEFTRQKIAGQAGAAEKLAAAKMLLPWFIGSGTCPAGHKDATLTYNSVLQLDYDDKTPGGDTRAAELLEICQKQPGVLMAAISPSGHGLKILVVTTNTDKEKHREALAAAIQIFAERMKVAPGKFDTLPASQPCFAPYNTPGRPAAYFNHDAQPLALKIESRTEKGEKNKRAETVKNQSKELLDAVQFLIENKHDVATHPERNYDTYLKVHAACKNEFGNDEGDLIALDILENSAAFNVSQYKSDYAQKCKSVNRRSEGRRATGKTLMSIAKKLGWIYCEANRTELQAKEGEKLLDSVKRTDTDIYGKYIFAGTGTGKTHAVCELAKNRKTILIVPTQALIRQIVKQHAHATAFFYENKKLPDNAGLIVTTAESFLVLATRINLAEYDGWLDEAHQLATATSPTYKLKTLRAVMELKVLMRSFGYLSGTPLYQNIAPSLRNVPQIIYKQDAAAELKRSVQFLEADNTFAAIISEAGKCIKSGQMVVIMLNDKNLRLAAITALANDKRTLIVNADVKENPEVQKLIEHGEIEEGTEAIICTSVIQAGNSIYDQRNFAFITDDMLHAAELAQATARPRKAESVSLYIVRPKGRKRNDEPISALRFFNYQNQEAQRICDLLNNPRRRVIADGTLTLTLEMTLRREIQNDAIKQIDNIAQPCELAIMNRVFEAEKRAQYASDELLANELKKYGFKVKRAREIQNEAELTLEVSAADGQLTADQKEKVKSAKAEHKEKTEKKYYDDLQELADAPNAEAVLMQADKERKLTKAQERVKNLTTKYSLPIHTAANLLLKEKMSDKAFRHFRAELSAEMLQESTEYMQLDTVLCEQIKALRKEFDKAELLTAAEVRIKLVKILEIDGTLNLGMFKPDASCSKSVATANRRALDYLRIFYDVKAETKKESEGKFCPRKYAFSLNKKAKFRGQNLPIIRDARLAVHFSADLIPAAA